MQQDSYQDGRQHAVVTQVPEGNGGICHKVQVSVMAEV